jgi:hypothetical protein
VPSSRLVAHSDYNDVRRGKTPAKGSVGGTRRREAASAPSPARPAKVTVTREHYTHIQLWNTATYLFHGIGVRLDRGYFHPFLAASVFSFFAFESYLNELGRLLDPGVWTRERHFFATGSRHARQV